MLARTPIARQLERPYFKAPFRRATEPIAVAVVGQRWSGSLSLPTMSFGFSAELTNRSGVTPSRVISSSTSSSMPSYESHEACVSVLWVRDLFLASTMSRMTLFESSMLST